MLCDLITQGSDKEMKSILHLVRYTEICKLFLAVSMLCHILQRWVIRYVLSLNISIWKDIYQDEGPLAKRLKKSLVFFSAMQIQLIQVSFWALIYFFLAKFKGHRKAFVLKGCHGCSASVLLCKSRPVTWSSFQTVLRHFCRHCEIRNESRYSILIVSEKCQSILFLDIGLNVLLICVWFFLKCWWKVSVMIFFVTEYFSLRF